MHNNSFIVSVVIPVYNGGKTLAATLESLVNQSFQDFEVIACIDGTSDNSEDILKKYASKFKKFTLLKNNRNRGLGSTMNRLVAAANGALIAIAEQDDFYYPDRLEIQVKVLNTQPDVGMVSGIAEFYDGTKTMSRFPGILDRGKQYPTGEDMFLLNYREQIKVVNTCLMFRKQIHVDNGLYFSQHYPSISIDWSYILRFSLVSNIYGVHNVLVKIDRTQNRDSVTSNKEKQFMAAHELIRSFAYEFPSLIKRQDYLYAKRTQKLIELSQHYGISFYFRAIGQTFLNWTDNRFYKKLISRLTKKVKN